MDACLFNPFDYDSRLLSFVAVYGLSGFRACGHADAPANVQSFHENAGQLCDKESSGALLSLGITYGLIEQVANAASGALINIVREGASIIGLMVLMFYNSWQLSAILLIVVPIVAYAIKLVSCSFS